MITSRFGRILLVTFGLMVAGIVFGAIAGGSAFSVVVLLDDGKLNRDAFLIGAFFGAPLGAITAPVLSWGLLRRVPLGRMFLACSIGTAIGGVLGWFLAAPVWDIITPVAGAFVGCVLAALALWSRTRMSPVASLH